LQETQSVQYTLASKLSYFLWSSMPDVELLRAAEKGTLRDPETLNAQARRMLADPKAWALVENFAGQWLEIRRLESAQPDRERFPDFDEYLRASMLKENRIVLPIRNAGRPKHFGLHRRAVLVLKRASGAALRNSGS
jgi:hypothetical protein